MDGGDFQKVDVECTKINLFQRLIDWIYSSEISFPNEDEEIFDLILLADEYLLEDLRRRCEDELLFRLDNKNALPILLLSFKFNTIVSENLIECCINTIIEDFEEVMNQHPDLESKISSIFFFIILAIPGLITKMFLFVHQKKTKMKRVAFLSRESSRDETFFSNN